MTEANEYLLKICIIGSNTKLNQTFGRITADNVFERDDLPTLGVDIPTKRITVGITPVKLIIVITAGQEFFGKLRPSYYRGASACIIVYDKGDIDSFKEVSSFYKRFIKYVAHSVPIGIVGIKTNTERITVEEGKKLAKELQCQYFEIKFADKKGIEQVFHKLAKQVVEN